MLIKNIFNLRVLMTMIYDSDFIIHDHSLIRFLERRSDKSAAQI